MASSKLSKTYSGNAANRKKWTVSAWFKRVGSLGSHADVVSAYRSADGLQTDVIRIGSDKKLAFYAHSIAGGTNASLKSTQELTDTTAWYHVVTAVDSTQGTAANRVKIYLNGTQVTDWSTETYPDQDAEFVWGQGSGVEHTIGAVSTSNYFDGQISHVHYCDGYQYQASDFGETDATTGNWKINTNPSVNYGTNGFWLLKDIGTGVDNSGQSNNYTVNGNLHKGEDNPSNIFCTGQTLTVQSANGGWNYAGTRWAVGPASWRMGIGTLGATAGKYYAEFKCTGSDGSREFNMGVCVPHLADTYVYPTQYIGRAGDSVGVTNDGSAYINGSAQGGYTMASFNTNDIIGIALDLDNKKVYFSKNGTFQNSGDPTSGASGTGALTLPSSTRHYTFGVAAKAGQVQCNWGNGYFLATAVSSPGTNASNNGIFEYDVPSGYTALSTKGMNL